MAGAHERPGGHTHPPDGEHVPAPPGVRKVLLWVMIPLVVLTVGALVLLWPDWPERPEQATGTFYDGTVTAVQEELCPPEVEAAGFARCGEVTVRMDEGPDAGREVVTPVPGGPGAPEVDAGDRVIVHAGGDPADPSLRQYAIADHQRGLPLIWLVALFAVVLVAFGRWRGVGSLAGLAACFGLLLTFVLPGIIAGRPPLLVAVVAAAAVLFIVMYLVHGISVRTSIAVLGTFGAVLITGLLGYLGGALTHLTGFIGDNELSLFTQYPELDLRGVLLAGIIIGSLGVLDDVTVTQAATVSEIARANPRLSRLALYRAGTRVGRAHVASVVNTLVLAYAGASLPLLLLVVVSGMGAGDALTSETIAQELVRSVVATVGLIGAVPLATGLAALVYGARFDGGGKPARSGSGAPVAPGEALAGRPAAWPAAWPEQPPAPPGT